jgi:hypothetical protein
LRFETDRTRHRPAACRASRHSAGGGGRCGVAGVRSRRTRAEHHHHPGLGPASCGRKGRGFAAGEVGIDPGPGLVPQAPARPLAMRKGGIAQVVQNKVVPPLTEEANQSLRSRRGTLMPPCWFERQRGQIGRKVLRKGLQAEPSGPHGQRQPRIGDPAAPYRPSLVAEVPMPPRRKTRRAAGSRAMRGWHRALCQLDGRMRRRLPQPDSRRSMFCTKTYNNPAYPRSAPPSRSYSSVPTDRGPCA